jgi:mannonate dehydratase
MRLAFGAIHDVNDDILKFTAQLGADGIIAHTQDGGKPDQGYLDFSYLINLRTRVESYGLRLEALELLPWHWTYKWMLGLPGRDEQIENFLKTLRNMGAAGIPILAYNMHSMRFYRTSSHTRGRGGADVTSFDLDLVRNAPLMSAGPGTEISLIPPSHRRPMSDADMWANFDYFIKAVVPVAEGAGVKLAIHPDDPPVPSIGGVARIMRSVDAFKRVVETVPSDYNGLLFCQGCYSEMGANIPETIRYFGRRKKIFYVHFRNVVGTAEKFAETFIDEGKTDMFEAMKAYKESGFDGVMTEDHAAHVVGDTPWGHRYRAFAMGYIKAMKKVVETLY